MRFRAWVLSVGRTLSLRPRPSIHSLLSVRPSSLFALQGPSSEALHLGHLVPFLFTKYLQDAFDVPLVIQLTDDEKFLWRGLALEESRRLARENARDIIACGFDINKTFIFADYDFVGGPFYRNISRIQRCVTMNQVRGIFGMTSDDYIGKIAFPATQAAPAFPDSFPALFGTRTDVRCLVPCAIDQDPYFRMTRDAAPRLHQHKTALLEARFFPALQGETGKMSASETSSAVFVTDSRADIASKVRKYAYSGGGATREEHAAHGANLDVDIAWQWLRFLMEDDDELERIGAEYGAGRMFTGQVKDRLIDVLAAITQRHQAARALVTDEVVDAFMAPRDMTQFVGGATIGRAPTVTARPAAPPPP